MMLAALRAAWQGRARFTVLLAGDADPAPLIAAWQAEHADGARLHLIVLQAEGPLPGMQRHPQADARVTLDWLVAPAWQGLSELRVQLDAVHLQQIAGHDWCRLLARLCVPGAILTADALDAAQRHGLEAQGFAFDRPDLARYMSRKPMPPAAPAPARTAVVLGAGVAGCSVAERLCARGWQVSLLDQHAAPAQEASGNLAGIFMPILSKDDAVPTRLTRAAYLFALRYWQGLGGVGQAFLGAQCGVLHLARDAAHAATQREIAARWGYPADFARWLEAPEASALLGYAAPHGAWHFPAAGWARPASACAAMLDAAGPRLQRQFGTGPLQIAPDADGWQVQTAAGATLARSPTLILASGAAALPPLAALPISSVRGQVSHLDAAHAPALSLVVCGEAYVTPLHAGVACAGASYDLHQGRALDPVSHADNLARASQLLGCDLHGAPLAGRVGFRAVAPDRLPLVGALPAASQAGRSERLRDLARQPGLYAALGYASRGLIWAPLMAELLVAQLEGEPLPLEASLAEALDPGRFLLRARRKGVS
ncbi:FAD-dependent 5-carboxymethylaminomethyl-2-thiouridine(34) oxidoreductase MnmC [Massilia sp. TS11]|uniref:FAD-dependent 5-carboxymethylaminomethyl-2-thiouridine(34) oxidoreductase MnmC n=1 Tax=Massilia sp. TS11 TaxID=2908003 RepID=UPI001ED9E9E9|nr:FAD-dependent 5-carboxymethylaminomethyl-2-thiouridine(34) oxidoreductase MnmC [Massilia sp. TS11]MCG2585020.1 FAD-dependent 5-carboxymethylaminomethyl-2-thiouridine(34) oxidoreductase MnmC [Massilia sp. TS11]